jgi:hypothetical protein
MAAPCAHATAAVEALVTAPPHMLSQHDDGLEDEPWDRMPDEPPPHYAAFRIYRDLAPLARKLTTVAVEAGISERQARVLANRWTWRERVEQWDDVCHRTEDHERLEAIRQMHALHRTAGRATLTKALTALQLLRPEDMTPGVVARMIDLGARLERTTLLVSVEEMQGFEVEDEEAEDAWERIARELDPDHERDD